MSVFRKVGEYWCEPSRVIVEDYCGGSRIWGVKMGDELYIAEPAEKVVYILAMRDPREHCDPLPEWMERPAIAGVKRLDDAEDVDHGIEVRRYGNHDSMNEDQSLGWLAQQKLAIEFYDKYNIGEDDHITANIDVYVENMEEVLDLWRKYND